MTPSDPPDEVCYNLEEALELLAALEDAARALADTDHLAAVVQMEDQIAFLSGKLGFDQPLGGEDGR